MNDNALMLENNPHIQPEKINSHPWEQGGGITIRIRAKEKNEAREQKVKKTIKTLFKTSLVLWGINGVLWLLDKARGDVRGTDETTFLNPQSSTEQLQRFDNRSLNLYSQGGMESPQLGIDGINSPDHLNEAPYSMYGTPVFNLTAEFGPSWLFAYSVNDSGEVIFQNDQPVISQAAFNDLVNQLGLKDNPQGQQILRENWIEAHNDPQIALNIINGTLIPGVQAHPQVVNFYQCSVNVFNQDSDKSTWEDRQAGIQTCAVEAKKEPPPATQTQSTSELTPNGSLSLKIAENIIKEGLHAGEGVINVFIKPLAEIAQGLVVNHQVPHNDDVQGYLTTAIEAADHLLAQIEQLPNEAREMVIQQTNHWKTEREQTPVLSTDHIFETPAEAINHLTGGGGWPMLLILAVECGLVAINSAKYLKRAKEMRNVPLPAPEKMRNDAIDFELNLPREKARIRRRGLPNGHIRAGTIVLSNLFGFKGEEVGAEIFMDQDLIRKETPDYLDLVSILRQGVNQAVIEVLDNRGLLITKTVKGNELKVVAIRARDLINVHQELAAENELKGRTLRGEVDWFGGEQADYKNRQPVAIKVKTGMSYSMPRVSEAVHQ